MKKRILFAFLFSVLLVAFSLLAHATDIGSANDLLTLMNTSSMWSGSYTLTADIDLSTATNGLSQAPIGNATTAFTGSFDGDGHTVSGINITAATTYTGLFGKAAGAVIRNLTVEGTVSSTANYTGGLLGGVDGASVTLQNCVNRCTVNGAASTAGIIGRVDAGSGTATISGCKNEGAITGTGNYTGGIIGTSTQNGASITVEQCMNTGEIRGGAYVGGIVGYWRAYSKSANKCTLQDCINTAAIYASQRAVGGIMGAGNGANYAYTLTRVFNSGSITCGGTTYTRPVAGATSKATSDGGKMTYCYYSSTDSYTSDSTGYSAANETYVADATVAANMPGLATDAWILVDGHTPELSVFHTHDHSGAYVSVGAMHQKTCYCGAVVDSAAHTFEGGVCTACGAEDIPCAHENKYEVVETPATCISTGTKYEFCPDCNIRVSADIVIPIDPSNHSGTLTMAHVGNTITYTCSGCGATVYTDSALASTVYVSENGLDLVGNLSGVGTAEKPFKNFTDALQYAAYCGKDVTVHILDSASVPAGYVTPSFDDTITVTGGVFQPNNRFVMNGEFIFEHMTISPTGTLVMAAKEHKLVMGEGLTMSGSSIYLVGGYEHVTCSNSNIPATGYSSDITLRSGVYGAVGGGNRYLSGAYSGTINLTIGKTNPADTLEITSTLTSASMNSEGGNGVSVTLLIDGPVDNINSFCPVTHATTADGRFDIDIVVQGAATTAAEKLYYRGSDYTVTAYADERVAGAEAFAAIVVGEENVQPYKRYCRKINGTHPDANGDTVCDNCGASTICTHEYGEWRQTAAANCASPAVYTWYCLDCKELIIGTTKNGDAVDPSNHISESYVWQYAGGQYFFACTGCSTHVGQASAPVLYVSQSGSNTLDGMTPEKAVATIGEAVTRMANVGGKVVICGVYTLNENLILPAYAREITISGFDNAGEYDGFSIAKNVVITLGGDTKFDQISFGGSSAYIFECLWNDTVFGTVQPYGAPTAHIALGRYAITANDTATESATLTLTEGVSQRHTASGAYDSTRFYAYIYLGDHFGADGLTVSNKTAVLNATDADIGILYTMSTSSKYKNNPVTACETTVNLYGATKIDKGRTGDYNVGYADSTATLDKQTLHFYDNAYIGSNYYIRNAADTVITVSTAAEGRTIPLRVPFTFYAYGTFASGSTPMKVSISGDSHSFSSTVASPCTFTSAANARKVYTESITNVCAYTAKVTAAATPTANGTKLYACTCGRSYTETYAYSCADATHIYTAKADGSFECSVCGAKTNAVIGDIRFALAPATTDNRSVTLTLSLDASEIAAARITIKAPAGFTFAGASIPEVSGFTVDAAAVGGTATIALLSTSAENTALDTSLTLSYSIDETVVYGDYVFDLSVPEAYDEDGEPLVATPVGAVVTALLVTPVVTNTDAYIDELGRGNVRIITTAHLPDVKDVTGYGTYFIPLAVFTGDGEALTRAVRLYSEGSLTDGETYSSDLMGIPEEFANETILAISFCIVGGEEVATAQYTFSVAELIG